MSMLRRVAKALSAKVRVVLEPEGRNSAAVSLNRPFHHHQPEAMRGP